jgi:predicted RNA-binding protein with PIN domain
MAQSVGWHRDKAGARERLVSKLTGFAEKTGATIDVVFDGPVAPSPAGYTVAIHSAPMGLTADDRILEIVAADIDPGGLVVVTSDRALAERAEALGARTVRSGEFRRLLDGSGG